ncbi:MAG: hypothetical protein M3Y86_11520 [Verrucomicrobiota bacterium]|nr:hypothetical protein [Verrucomicrobiota bacterium]
MNTSPDELGAIPALMIKIFGQNWRTSLSGLSETAAAVVLVLYVLPPETWQKPSVYIPLVLGTIAKTVKDLHTRDKGVSSVDMGIQSVASKADVQRVVVNRKPKSTKGTK